MTSSSASRDGGASASQAPPRRRQGKKLRLRPWLRALHRDAGYLAIGLTLIYAISGIAVNHIQDWDPNFTQLERTHQLKAPLPTEDQALTSAVLAQLGIQETPTDIYRSAPDQLDVTLPSSTLHVNPTKLTAFEEGQEPRWFLRLANWLHLNRGKKAWTLVADGYAAFLLFLAVSGLFMLPGRKGLLGRGAVLTALGAAIPAAYVILSGGP